MKFSDIVKQLSPEINSLNLDANNDPDIIKMMAIKEALANSLSYIEGEQFAKMITKTQASALILPLNETLQNQATEKGIAWMATSYPKLTFAQALNLFYQPFQPSPQIHPSAIIDPTTQLGENVYIGANVVIQGNVKIGNDVSIHPNVVIYPDVTIGDRTVLHGNCTIQERSQIGSDCMIHSGAVIGSEGFGFVPIPEGWYKMQQSGITVLEDGVEVGCNSTVDRPAVGETRIKKNTKLDNLVHIAHNCQVGENCAFAAQVGLAGSVTVGNRVMLGGQVGVANQAKIGDGAIATAQTGIHNEVKPGEIVSSSPAVPHKLYLKISAIYKRLPEMYQVFKKIQKKL
jgi:UDP-3-O-[3-hydroxymyristoyl] glucosamine N-acyltransferase